MEEAIERLRANDPTLTILDLWTAEIGYETAKSISESLKLNTHLTSLFLQYVNLEGSREFAESFAEALQVNTTLINLNIYIEGLDGIPIIATALKFNKSLLYLDLKHNTLGNVNAIADMLRVNKSIIKLDLSGTRIRNEGARTIAEALKFNNTLESLDMRNNNFGLFGQVLQINHSLTYLNLSGNVIRHEGAKEIAEALKINNTLKVLNLSRNVIRDSGAKAIAEALKVNMSLTSLYLQNNSIEKGGKDALKNVLEHYNGMITDFSPDISPQSTDRNRKAHQRVKKEVLRLLAIGKYKFSKQNIFIDNDDAFTRLLRLVPKDVYGMIARRLWATRGDSSWWTEEVKEPLLKRDKTSNCIQCNLLEARFMEETQPNYRFCSELCQWMLRVGSRHGISLEGVFE